jgi:hypothetical protein
MTTLLEWCDKYAKAIQGLLYALECNLATIANLAMVKRTSKREFERQISIAQTTLNCIKECGYDPSDHGSRISDVCKQFDGSVEQWAKAKREKWSA